MPTRTTPAKKRTAATKRQRPQRKTESETPELQAHNDLQTEQAELQQPGRVGRADAEFIDNDPGYSEDQLSHMREYYGLVESTAAVAEV